MIVASLSVMLICVFLVLFAIKLLWNFALPYGMAKMKNKVAVSFFPLIELVPLLLAGFVAWISSQSGWLSSSRLLIAGFVLAITSYLHFAIVAAVYAWFERIQSPNADERTNDGDSRIVSTRKR